MSQGGKEGKFYQVKRKDFKWVLSGILFQIELVVALIKKESKDRILEQSCLWACHKLEHPHYSFVTMCTVTGMNDVAPARHGLERCGETLGQLLTLWNVHWWPTWWHHLGAVGHTLLSLASCSQKLPLPASSHAGCVHVTAHQTFERRIFCLLLQGLVSLHVMLWFSLILTNLPVIWINLPATVDKNTSTEPGVEKTKVPKCCFKSKDPDEKPPASLWESSCSLPSSLCLGKTTRKSWVKMSRRH